MTRLRRFLFDCTFMLAADPPLPPPLLEPLLFSLPAAKVHVWSLTQFYPVSVSQSRTIERLGLRQLHAQKLTQGFTSVFFNDVLGSLVWFIWWRCIFNVRGKVESPWRGHIFPKAHVAANKNVHNFWHCFLVEYSMPFHMVWSILLGLLAPETTFWLVEIL